MTLHRSLTPLSWLYGLGVAVRNSLFDHGLLKSQQFPIPVIAVGNVAVGGTGKTPHVEHIVGLLKADYQIAVLSRGYKRHTKGFVMADGSSTANDIGDEPLQIKQKHADITVAVDEDRCHGIRQLMLGEATRHTEAIVLDDAFQHRHVKPQLSIVLVEHNRAIGDRLMPVGRLREPMKNLRRADVVIVTKCPDNITAGECQRIRQALPTRDGQPVFFSTMAYGRLQPIFKGDGTPTGHDLTGNDNVLLVTGIANPSHLLLHVEQQARHVTHLSFGDHHAFSEKDINSINDTFAALPSPKILITTEKDAARLRTERRLSSEVRHNIYTQPIQVKFLAEGEKAFNQMVTGTVHNDNTKQ